MKKTIITLLSTLALTGCLEGPKDVEQGSPFANGPVPVEVQSYEDQFIYTAPSAHAVRSTYFPDKITVQGDEPNGRVLAFGGITLVIRDEANMTSMLVDAKNSGYTIVAVDLNDQTLTLTKDILLDFKRVAIINGKIIFNGNKIVFTGEEAKTKQCSYTSEGKVYASYQEHQRYLLLENIHAIDLVIESAAGAWGERGFNLTLDKTLFENSLHISVDGGNVLFNKVVPINLESAKLDRINSLTLVNHPAEWKSHPMIMENFLKASFKNTAIDSYLTPTQLLLTSLCINYGTAKLNKELLEQLGVSPIAMQYSCSHINDAVVVKKVCKGASL